MLYFSQHNILIKTESYSTFYSLWKFQDQATMLDVITAMVDSRTGKEGVIHGRSMHAGSPSVSFLRNTRLHSLQKMLSSKMQRCLFCYVLTCVNCFVYHFLPVSNEILPQSDSEYIHMYTIIVNLYEIISYEVVGLNKEASLINLWDSIFEKHLKFQSVEILHIWS